MAIIQRIRKFKQDVKAVRFLKIVTRYFKKALPIMKTSGDIILAEDWQTHKQAMNRLNAYTKKAVKDIEAVKVPENIEELRTLTLLSFRKMERATYYGSIAAQERIDGKPATTSTMASINKTNEATDMICKVNEQAMALLSKEPGSST